MKLKLFVWQPTLTAAMWIICMTTDSVGYHTNMKFKINDLYHFPRLKVIPQKTEFNIECLTIEKPGTVDLETLFSSGLYSFSTVHTTIRYNTLQYLTNIYNSVTFLRIHLQSLESWPVIHVFKAWNFRREVVR